MYYVLDCHSPLEAEHYTLEASDDGNDKRWEEGVLFSEHDKREGFHPPTKVIGLETQPEDEEEEQAFVYPELTWIPIPLMSRRLVLALQAAGVDNLQTYETRLVTVEGKNPPHRNYYLAVNIVGLVEAADFAKSEVNPAVKERMISMDFYSLAIDEAKAKDLSMFRLAENISAVLVHERVKEQVEAAGITTLTWIPPEEWAG
jgi:uncharacterized protein DUF1629